MLKFNLIGQTRDLSFFLELILSISVAPKSLFIGKNNHTYSTNRSTLRIGKLCV